VGAHPRAYSSASTPGTPPMRNLTPNTSSTTATSPASLRWALRAQRWA